MHRVLRSSELRFRPCYPAHAQGHSRCSLVDRSAGSVHLGFGFSMLEAGGHVDEHLHSFEESFYVLEGTPTLILDGKGYRLAA